jgi:dienelactone hydrolase
LIWFLIFLFQAFAFDVETVRPPVPGYMYQPVGVSKAPAVLILHGSGGGNEGGLGEQSKSAQQARYFSSRGYVALALCYFDCKHLPDLTPYPPDELVRVDIDKHVFEAYQWLKKTYSKSNGKIAVIGKSRGAELALLIASSLEKKEGLTPNLVVALSPSDQLIAAWTAEMAKAKKEGKKLDVKNKVLLPAWVLNGVDRMWGEKLDVSASQIPYLISYFKTDPVWPSWIDADRLYQKSLQNPQTQLLVIDPTSDEKIQWPHKNKKHLFLKINQTGHVFSKDPGVFEIQKRLLDQALDTFLK